MKEKRGYTLVESILAISLMIMVLAFVAPTLSAATKIFYRMQNDQYASSIMDTVMTELRSEANEVTHYIKIYSNGNEIVSSKGVTSGLILEYENQESYVVLLSSDGTPETSLYRAGQDTGAIEASIPVGRLVKRYYFRNDGDSTFKMMDNGKNIARAVASVYGDGFYMGNYLNVTFELPEGINVGDKTNQIIATVALYRDKDNQDLIISESEVLEFKDSVEVKNEVTVNN